MHKQTQLLAGSIITVVALVLATPALAGVPNAGPAADSEIEVTGEGMVHTPPDVARLTLGVEVYGTRVPGADSEVDQRVNDLVRLLRSAGVAEGHIRTAGLVIEPRYETRSGEPMELRGFVVRNMLEVETADITGLPSLLDAAIAGGANRVDKVQFESRNLADLQSAARDRAWQSARAKAEQLAQRSGLRLGTVVRAEEPLLEAVSSVRADSALGAPAIISADQGPLQRGEIEVRAQVHVVWSATQ